MDKIVENITLSIGGFSCCVISPMGGPRRTATLRARQVSGRGEKRLAGAEEADALSHVQKEALSKKKRLQQRLSGPPGTSGTSCDKGKVNDQHQDGEITL